MELQASPEMWVTNRSRGVGEGGSIMARLDDRFIVAWRENMSTHYEVWAITYRTTGEQEGEPYLLHSRAMHLHSTDLDLSLTAVAPNLLAVAVLRLDKEPLPPPPNHWRVIDLSFFNRLGGHPTSIMPKIHSTELRARQNPSIAAIAGGLVVTWSTVNSDMGLDGVAQIISQNGSKIGDRFPIATQTDGAQTGTYVTSTPIGFAVSWTDHTPAPHSKLRFFDHQGKPLSPETLIDNGTAPVRFAVGPDRVLAVWYNDTNCLGKFFDFTGITITDSFRISNGTQRRETWPHATCFQGRYAIVWTEWSDNSIRGVWLSDQGKPINEPFAINTDPTKTTDPPRSFVISTNSEIVAIWETVAGIKMRLFTNPATPATHLTTRLLNCNYPTVTVGEVVTFVPAGISGAGIAGWIISGILLAIAMGLGYLLSRRETAPTPDEEQQPQYASLPPARPDDRSHYVGMNVINEDYDKAVKEAIDLLSALNYKVTAQT